MEPIPDAADGVCPACGNPQGCRWDQVNPRVRDDLLRVWNSDPRLNESPRSQQTDAYDGPHRVRRPTWFEAPPLAARRVAYHRFLSLVYGVPTTFGDILRRKGWSPGAVLQWTRQPNWRSAFMDELDGRLAALLSEHVHQSDGWMLLFGLVYGVSAAGLSIRYGRERGYVEWALGIGGAYLRRAVGRDWLEQAIVAAGDESVQLLSASGTGQPSGVLVPVGRTVLHRQAPDA